MIPSNSIYQELKDILKLCGTWLPNMGGMSLIEFDGYFEGKFEPVKYIRAEIHTSDIDEQDMINFANKVRLKLKQKSLAIEFNNRLILISED